MKSSIKYGLVLFSVLMAISLGVAIEEKQMVSNNTSKVVGNNTSIVVGNNTSKTLPMNNSSKAIVVKK